MRIFILQHKTNMHYQLEIRKIYEVDDGVIQEFYEGQFMTTNTDVILKHSDKEQLIIMMSRVINE